MDFNHLAAEIGTVVTNSYVNKLKDTDPQKLDELERLFINLTEVAVHILRESAEFRTQFARIHAEFLKYPECQQVINETLAAVEKYRPELLKD